MFKRSLLFSTFVLMLSFSAAYAAPEQIPVPNTVTMLDLGAKSCVPCKMMAPVLAIITVQQRVVEGIALILFFALGHCLPIVLAGSSVALSQRLVEAKGMRLATQWGRKLAGLLVIGIGLYFAVSPFIV